MDDVEITNAVIELYGDMSGGDIAEMLGVPIWKVYSAVTKARDDFLL